MRRSSTSGPPESIVFFTDRDLGPSVAAALAAGGLLVEPFHRHFPPDASDQEWLRLVGERGWIALTHNKRIRYEADELDELMSCGVRAFFIIGKGPHPELARAILDGSGRIFKLLRKQRGPFVARVYQHDSRVEIWVTYEEWERGRSHSSRRPKG